MWDPGWERRPHPTLHIGFCFSLVESIVLALFMYISPPIVTRLSRNSDQGSFSGLFSPPPHTHYGRRHYLFNGMARRVEHFLPSSTRVEFCVNVRARRHPKSSWFKTKSSLERLEKFDFDRAHLIDSFGGKSLEEYLTGIHDNNMMGGRAVES